MTERKAQISRTTRETDITVSVNVDGSGQTDIQTGIGFLDHMLTALGHHAHVDIVLRCKGDLSTDDHHTAEDCAICLGTALHDALGDRRGIVRFGSAFAPLDEALARAVVDLATRPYACVDLGLRRESIGTIASENLSHVLQTLATATRMTLHVDVLKGDNDHHRVEAAFKALALAFREAAGLSDSDQIASTKGVL